VADQRGALFLQQSDLPLFLGNEGVNALGLPVEKGGDGTLFTNSRWERYLQCCKLLACEMCNGGFITRV
jgi:hypothetical protein